MPEAADPAAAQLFEQSARLAEQHARLLEESARLLRDHAALLRENNALLRAALSGQPLAEVPESAAPVPSAPPSPAAAPAFPGKPPTGAEVAAHDKEEEEQVQTLIEIYLRANGKPQFEGFESDIVPGHSGRKEGFAANRCGNGPALIYLPGLQSNDLLFWANRADLAKRLTVYGVRYRTAGEPTPEKYAGDILEMMDLAGVEKAHVLGESMGSIPAQWLAANHPGRVESLTIAGGFARPPDQFRMALANALKPLVPAGMTRWLIQRFIAARANLKKDMGGHLSPEVVEAFAELRKSGKVRVMRRRLRMIAQWDFHQALPLIRQPFLYMYGERDLIVPVHREAKRYRERLPQAELLELPGATHSILFTRPEETTAAILDFVLRDRSAPLELPAPAPSAPEKAKPEQAEEPSETSPAR